MRPPASNIFGKWRVISSFARASSSAGIPFSHAGQLVEQLLSDSRSCRPARRPTPQRASRTSAGRSLIAARRVVAQRRAAVRAEPAFEHGVQDLHREEIGHRVGCPTPPMKIRDCGASGMSMRKNWRGVPGGAGAVPAAARHRSPRRLPLAEMGFERGRTCSGVTSPTQSECWCLAGTRKGERR